MKYLVLLIGDGELKAWPDHTEEEQQEVMRQFEAFDEACRERVGVTILAGEALAGPSHATTVRTRGGRTSLTEGPYAEVIEAMGGFYLVEAPDLDVLVELLGILPAYDIQISPAVDPY
ncbi:YciI family protein [Nocardioides sp. S-58]|uniref:YciI family protein n=1 Tax=Nocardioides renjunii TaxID=3095075 RepID=A0ABU5KA50_9ACTN|nr:YciI family protein [Nocardioides sp. S-58]MDZ5661857.1 YciI family protein [Nocardioides sp. S-58]